MRHAYVVNLEASTFNWANLKSKLTAHSTGGPKILLKFIMFYLNSTENSRQTDRMTDRQTDEETGGQTGE